MLFVVMVTVMHLSPLVICNQSTIFRQEYKGITRVPQEIPSGTVQIYLDHNNIMNITNSPFIDNTLCTKLSMDHNALVEIRESYWTGLWELRWLFLQFNQIQYIWPSAFSNLRHLKGLYLKSNKLETLSMDIFNPNFHPAEFHMTLQRNPLTFDSRLCWLQDGMENGWIIDEDSNQLGSVPCSLLSTVYTTKGSYSSYNFNLIVLNSFHQIQRLIFYSNYVPNIAL